MKKIFCIIFSFCFLSSVSAEEIPYELLTNRMIEKLQMFGMRAVDYYSMNLYGSNDTESLIKTRHKIESFPKNKETCGEFIYYWWYVWAPMSEQGFIENVYMTPSEAYNCSIIGEAFHNNKQMTIKDNERNQYLKWSEEGVPASVTPNIDAELQANIEGDLVEYIAKNRTENLYKKNIRIKIGSDSQLSCLSSNEDDEKILDLLNLKVISPACYLFENSRLFIPMESIETIIIEEERRPVRSRLITGQYEASVKFNQKTSSWDIQISKNYLEDWNEDTKPNSQEYYNAIIDALNKLPTKPKKYIKFHILTSSIFIDRKGKRYGLGHIEFPPIVVIDSSQSGFAKACNW